ncbi:MAG: lipid-A-disaccharide synthase [Pyrinomonadaceae bacterium]
MSSNNRIMIVAGEASGDVHAAKVVKAMREAEPGTEFEFFGSAGRLMSESGVEALVNADELSIVGLPEIGRALPMFIRTFRKLRNAALERRPDIVVLVDFPEFNLKLAKSLKKLGFRVVYYISPQLWAWRKYRIGTIRKYVDLLITILPFEKDWYEQRGVGHVEYVGSPLAMEVHADSSKEDFCRRSGLDPTRPIITLLPGSRHKEIIRILPVLLKVSALMASKDRRIQFIVAIASERNELDAKQAINSATARGILHPEVLIVAKGETYNALNASDAAAVTSGTATLETGIIGTPQVIVYKSSVVNYMLMRPLISVEHFGLINLIAGKRVAQEMIQGGFTPEAVSGELFRLLEPETNAQMRRKLKEAAETLGHGGASMRAAKAILKVIRG